MSNRTTIFAKQRNVSAFAATLAVVLFAGVGYLLYSQRAVTDDQVALQSMASPQAVEGCAAIAKHARGPFAQARELAVMDECLRQFDASYAKAREDTLCATIRASGIAPSDLSDRGRKCLGKTL